MALEASSLRANEEPLQNRIFVVHGPDQVVQARGGRRNMNGTRPLVLPELKDRASFIFIRQSVDGVRFPWVVDEREGW